MADKDSIQIEARQERDVWVAMTNTDLTEGRGHQVVYAVAESPEAAARIGARRYVQGCDCPIEKSKAYLIGARWYIPGQIHQETATDTQNRLNREAREAEQAKVAEVIERAKALGMAEEDLAVLMKAKESAQ